MLHYHDIFLILLLSPYYTCKHKHGCAHSHIDTHTDTLSHIHTHSLTYSCTDTNTHLRPTADMPVRGTLLCVAVPTLGWFGKLLAVTLADASVLGSGHMLATRDLAHLLPSPAGLAALRPVLWHPPKMPLKHVYSMVQGTPHPAGGTPMQTLRSPLLRV